MRTRVGVRMLAVVALLVALGGWGATPVVEASPSRALVGFSFTDSAARYWGQEPAQALASLLDRMDPDLVRLPVYWEDVQPSADVFDFATVDQQLDVIKKHNLQTPQRPTLVMLVVGARNIGYPEVHLPGWIRTPDDANFQQVIAGPEYRRYLEMAFRRYAPEPLLYAWQVENEPLDNIQNRGTGPINLTTRQVSSDLRVLRSIDRRRPAVVTTYNSTSVDLDKKGASLLAPVLTRLGGPQPAGSPRQALGLGDVLGLDAYVVTPPFTSMDPAEINRRIDLKAPTLDYWSDRARHAGKELWLTEVQAAPWETVPGFNPSALIRTATVYRGRGYHVLLFWDVEQWLNSDDWMTAGARAFDILRG